MAFQITAMHCKGALLGGSARREAGSRVTCQHAPRASCLPAPRASCLPAPRASCLPAPCASCLPAPRASFVSHTHAPGLNHDQGGLDNNLALEPAQGVPCDLDPAQGSAHQAAAVEVCHLSRRQLLAAGLLAPSACMLSSSQVASAAIVDESNSTSVFSSLTASLVGVKLSMDGKLERVGSGFVWDKYGHIVTDERCAKKKSGMSVKVVVTGADGRETEYDAVLCGTSTSYGIGVIRVDDAAALAAIRPITVSPSAKVHIGQTAYAMGQMGGDKSMSVGIISGLNRSIPSSVGTVIYGVMQTDASIGFNNTGGPLVDSSGHVIGLNLAPQYSGRQGSSGINFAIPSDVLLDIVPKLAAFGTASGKT